MSRSTLTLVVAAVLAAVLAVVGLSLRVPYVEFSPGPTYDALGSGSNGKPIIEITGRPTFPTSGQLRLVTVSVQGGPPGPINLGQALRGWLDRTVAVMPQEVVYPAGSTAKQVEQESTQQMVSSQDQAVTAALRYLKVPVATSVAVVTVRAGLPAAGRLRPGDVVLTVDGRPVTSAAALRTLVSGHRPGDTLLFEVRRGAAAQTIALRTAADPTDATRAVIGIETTERPVYPFRVKVGLSDVGGPSAGLIFALAIIDRLTTGQLTGGRVIAATGTVDENGRVGPIGGVAQKEVSAKRDGASIFLVPAGDCAEARPARPDGLRLVRVDSLAGAMASLSALRSGGTVPAC